MRPMRLQSSGVNESDCGGLNGARVLFIQTEQSEGRVQRRDKRRRENKEKREYLAG